MAAIAFVLAFVLLGAAIWLARHKPKEASVWVRPFGPAWMPTLRWLLVTALLLLSPVAFLFGPWFVMTIRCGHQPISTTNFAAASSYSLPGDTFYDRTWLLGDGYVCSEDEALRKGYHRSH
jgi:hypothetical protein